MSRKQPSGPNLSLPHLYRKEIFAPQSDHLPVFYPKPTTKDLEFGKLK